MTAKAALRKPAPRRKPSAKTVPFTQITFTGPRQMQALADVLEQAVECTADDESGRPVLETVCIEIDKPHEMMFTSADGCRLIHVRMGIRDTGIDPATRLERTLVHRDSVRAAVKLLRTYKRTQDASATLIIDDNAITLKTVDGLRGTALLLERFDGTYPAYEKLIPPVEDPGDGWRVALNGRYLESVGRLGRRFSDTGIDTGIVRIQPGKDSHQPVRFDWISQEYETTCIVMPMFVQW